MDTNKFIIFVLPMILLIAAAIVGTAFALPENDTYVFVHCYDEGTGGTINYPPGTECLHPSDYRYPDNYYNNGYPNSNELTDDDLEEDEEEQDEEEHQIESEEYDNER